MRRRELLALLPLLGRAAEPSVWTCPMDPEVRTPQPGRCPRCRMALVPYVTDLREYPITLTVQPRAPRPGQSATLTFRVYDPSTGVPVRRFSEIHERLFHLFVVSEDLAFFAHEHPELQPDGSFRWRGVLPQPGTYRLVCDFVPWGGAPQFVAKSVILPGTPPPAPQRQPLLTARGENVTATLRCEPEQPLAGKEVRLRFALDPAGQLEPWLGAPGHLLAASPDLIDMMHAHPETEGSGPGLEFHVLPPRAGLYRVWLQVQRAGVLNTLAFNVPVAEW